MRKRYFARRLDIVEETEVDATLSLARTVYEPDPSPYNTGLLDASGEPLWAVIELDQIGFVRQQSE